MHGCFQRATFKHALPYVHTPNDREVKHTWIVNGTRVRLYGGQDGDDVSARMIGGCRETLANPAGSTQPWKPRRCERSETRAWSSSLRHTRKPPYSSRGGPAHRIRPSSPPSAAVLDVLGHLWAATIRDLAFGRGEICLEQMLRWPRTAGVILNGLR